MKTTSLVSALALATMTAAGLTTLALAQQTTTPATPPVTEMGPDAMPGMGHGRGGMMAGPGLDFATLDADKDGKITKAEMEDYRAARTAEIDADGDGFLSADELAAMQIKAFTERAQDMAARMVTMMDADNDGKLSAAELAARPGPEMMFDRIDADGDGAVTQAEVDAAKAGMMERVGMYGGMHGGGHRGGHGGEHEGRGWGFGWFGGDDDEADGN
jgi:hypothetical protein